MNYNMFLCSKQILIDIVTISLVLIFELLILLIADLIVELCRRYKSYQLADRMRIIQFVTVTSNFHLSQLSVLHPIASTSLLAGSPLLLSKYPSHMIN